MASNLVGSLKNMLKKNLNLNPDSRMKFEDVCNFLIRYEDGIRGISSHPYLQKIVLEDGMLSTVNSNNAGESYILSRGSRN